jgi:hypothetical protein
MLTLLASVAIMIVVVGSLVAWAKREQRLRAATSDGPRERLRTIKEVPRDARHHR